MKKRRLKSWVKTSLAILVFFIIVIICLLSCLNDKEYQNCDTKKGHTCTYYEAHQTFLNK